MPVSELMSVAADEFNVDRNGVVSFWLAKNGSFCNGAELVCQFKASYYSIIKNNSVQNGIPRP
jgi:hypothetical protein